MNSVEENSFKIAKPPEDQPTQAAAAKKSSFASDVLKLVSGTAFAQVLTVLAAPVLARIFDPSAFGVYSLFASIMSILIVVSSLTYELSIVLPEKDEDAANQLSVSLIVNFLTCVLLLPLIGLFGPQLTGLLQAPELLPYLWLVPVILFFGGIGAGHPGLNYWNYRTRQFTRLTVAQVISSITTLLGQLGLGLFGFTSGGGLIGGASIGSMIPTFWLAKRIWRDDGKLIKRSVRWHKMIQGIKRYRKFPLYNTWSQLLNTASWQLPSLLLSSFFSPTVVGYYALGNRVLKMPMNMIGGAISRSFLPRAAEATRTNTLPSIAEALFQRLIAFTFFPLLTLTITGKEFFIIIFGSNWADAGVFAQILSLFTFVWFISSPISNLLTVLEKQEFLLRLNVVIFTTRVFSLVVGGLLQSPFLALLLFTITGIFVYGYLSVKVMKLAGVSYKKTAQMIGMRFAQFVPFGLILVVMKYVKISPVFTVLAASVGVGIYLLIVISKDAEIQRTLMKIGVLTKIRKTVDKILHR